MDDIPLGKPATFPDHYDRRLLARIDRAPARRQLGIRGALPFAGADVWNGYEFSWLNPRGLPQVAGLRLTVDARSPRMVESKSMKLYLNGFAQTRFESVQALTEVLTDDLSGAFGAPVHVALPALDALAAVSPLPGECLDGLDVATDVYERDPGLLTINDAGAPIDQELHTHLFRSLCPVTGQPDWASILIRCRGPAIEHASVLRYLVSFRRHQAFHETTIEQIWLDIAERCRCEQLLVAGYFLRRGGLDINPFRSNGTDPWQMKRLARQ